MTLRQRIEDVRKDLLTEAFLAQNVADEATKDVLDRRNVLEQGIRLGYADGLNVAAAAIARDIQRSPRMDPVATDYVRNARHRAGILASDDPGPVRLEGERLLGDGLRVQTLGVRVRTSEAVPVGHAIVESADGSLLVVGPLGSFRSTNGGETWEPA